MSDPAEFGASKPNYLHAEALEVVLKSVSQIHLDPGEILVQQGEASDAAFFLDKGTVSVYAETLFGSVPLATIFAPQLIGEIGVLADLPRTATIKAVTPSTAYRISRSELLEIGRKTPDLLIFIIGQLGRQLDAVNRAVSLYTNALAALEKREFDSRILEQLENPPPQLAEFSAAFHRFSSQILNKRRQHDELASAAIIQQSFLPNTSNLAAIEGVLELHAEMRPAREVGGDFYDFFMLDADHLAIAIGDICGKGIAASLFMAVVVTVLRTAAHEEKDVASTIARANAVLCRDNASSMFATVFYAVLNLRTGVLEYCNCGHNAPFLLLSSGETRSFPATGLPLALYADRTPAMASVTLNHSDTLVLFTDGVTEAMNLSQEELGETALIETLATSRDSAMAEIISRIFSTVDSFSQGAEQTDDITCIAIRRRPTI
jgi:sigma-B regulation protein RsbU (phosphoserine phosphatase)